MTKRTTAALLAGLAILSAPAPAKAGADTYLAEVMIFAGTFCPRGYMKMDGRLLPISANPALFSLIGTLYGGNGSTTFALPTAMPIFAANGQAYMQCIAVEGIFPSRP